MTLETLNTHKETPPSEEQQKHEKEMLAKANSLEGGSEERPEWLPEKFKTAEDMAKAYASLEKKMGSGEAKSEEPKQTEESESSQDQDATEVAQVLDKAGVDFNSLQEEYASNNGLGDESYKKLEEAGFSKELVDSWIAGQQSLADDITTQVFSSVGGEEQYYKMVEWAAESLPPAEVAAFNNAVDSGDMSMVNMAVNGLAARYQAEVGTEPQLIQGETTGNSGGSFQSAAELTAAMRDPRYQNDPAYRNAVSEKLSRSNVF